MREVAFNPRSEIRIRKSEMLLLAYRNLRARLGRTLFTAFAIALGVALVFATRIVSVTAERQAAAIRASKLAGADLEVSPARAQFFPVSITDDILKNPAVEKVAPVYKHTLAESQLELLGVDPEQVLSPDELIAGQFIAANDEILLPDIWAAQHGLGVGQTVRLTIEEEPYQFKVVGLLTANPLGRPSALLPLNALQATLGQPGAATSMLVRLRPGAALPEVKEALADSLGAPYVVTSARDSATSLRTIEDFSTVIATTAFPFASLVVLLASAYVIYNAFALTLTERKREIGQLRALGMTRGQVLRQTLSEALLMTGAGSLVGLPLGLGLALALVPAVAGVTADFGAGQLGLTNTTIPPDGILLAVSVGVLVTLATTFGLAWQAGRVSPLTAISGGERSGEAQTRAYVLYERWGWAVALGLALAWWATNAVIARSGEASGLGLLLDAFVSLIFLPLAVVLALPGALRGGLWAVERAFPRSVVMRLGASNIRKQRSRALFIALMFAVSLMLVVSFAGATVGLTGLFLTQLAGPYLSGDFMLVRPDAIPNAILPPVPAALESDLAALGSEAQVLDYGVTSLPGYDILPSGSELTGANDVTVASLDFLRAHPSVARPVAGGGSLAEGEGYVAAGPTLFLTEIAARRQNLRVGDTTVIATLEGPVTFTVGLVHIGQTFIPTEYGQRYFGVYPAVFLVNVLPGKDKAALAGRLEALARKHSLLLVEDLAQWSQQIGDQYLGALIALFAGLTSITGLLAGLNLINVLVASVLERQRELGTLRALGLTQAQVRGLVVAEAGLLGLVGSVLGVVAALGLSWASVRLIGELMRPILGPLAEAPTLPWAAAGLAVALMPAIAMLAALYPADRAAAVNPADAMRAEGSTGFLKPAPHLGPTGLRGLVARMPLAAKLSFSLGVVFVLTVAILTAFRVNYERRLIEDNMRAIIARGFDALNSADAFKPDLAELTPDAINAMQQQAGAQADLLQAQFRGGDSPFAFNLKYLFIADAQNKILLSNRAEYNHLTLTNTVEFVGSASVVRLTDWTGERVFEVALPIENKVRKRIGSARLGFSSEAMDNIVQDIVQSSVLTMAIALAISVLLTIFLTRRALAPVAEVVTASRAVARGDLARRVPETRWDDVGQLARAFNEMVSGLNDRERMRDLFGRYLSREVSEAVLAGRVTLGGERKTITCLYVDMRGSTSFAEKHAPEDVMAALNQYFEVIILATEAHGGIVNRFVGDEAVCVFGAPTEYADHADRAVQAALSMRAGLSYVNQKRTALGLPTLKFGIGVNTGELTAGATGSEERQEYTVIGDAMNTGARIQALTKTFPDHDILLSEFTHTALRDSAAFQLTDLGEAELRGKSTMVRVFGMVGTKH